MRPHRLERAKPAVQPHDQLVVLAGEMGRRVESGERTQRDHAIS